MKLIKAVKNNQPTEVKKTKLNNLSESLGMTIDWQDDHGTGVLDYAGFDIAGSVDVTNEAVTLTVELPAIARMRKKYIENEIEKALLEVLD